MAKSIVIQNDLSRELKEQFSKSKVLGIDCEMMGLDPSRDRLCLVQIAADSKSYVLVQIGKKENAPILKELLEDEGITKIFHFARMDILFLYCRLGIDVKNIYCTKIASKIARTYSSRHSLRELVREFTGNNLDKTCQSSDWGKEKLSSEQIHYAGNDVIYLFEIHKNLDMMLRRENRNELFEKVINFLPVQRELDCKGYEYIFEHAPP